MRFISSGLRGTTFFPHEAPFLAAPKYPESPSNLAFHFGSSSSNLHHFSFVARNMVQKIASNKLAGCPTVPTNRGGGEKMPKKRRPNYMKPTKSSDARREKPQVSTIYSPTSTDKNSKSLNPSKSSSSSPLRPFKNKPTRATCSSTLKNSMFPKALELHPGGTEAQGTSAMRVCPYKYCSLNGDWHEILPPLKSFISAKRKLLNTRKSFKLKGLPLFKVKASVKDEKQIVDDFFLKISAKVEEFEDLQLQRFGERNTQTTNKYYYDMHMGDDLDEKTDLSIEEMDSMLSLLEYVEFNDAIEDQEEVKEEREPAGLPTLNATSINWGEEEVSIANHKSNLSYLPDDVLGPSSKKETIGDVLSSEPFSALCEMADADAEQFIELIKLETKQTIGDEIPEDVIPTDRTEEEDMDDDSEDVIHTDSTEEEDMDDEIIEELTINHDVHNQSDENNDRNWVSYSTNEHEEVGNVEGSIQSNTKQNSLEIDLVSEIEDDNYETDDVFFASSKGSTEDKATNTATTNTKQPLAETNDVTKARTRIMRQKISEEAEQMKEFNPRSPRFLETVPEPEAEKVDLRHQMTDERKNGEEWMIDYALQRVISKLEPSRKRKVNRLIMAFETVMPPSMREEPLFYATSSFAPRRIIQPCS